MSRSLSWSPLLVFVVALVLPSANAVGRDFEQLIGVVTNNQQAEDGQDATERQREAIEDHERKKAAPVKPPKNLGHKAELTEAQRDAARVKLRKPDDEVRPGSD